MYTVGKPMGAVSIFMEGNYHNQPTHKPSYTSTDQTADFFVGIHPRERNGTNYPTILQFEALYAVATPWGYRSKNDRGRYCVTPLRKPDDLNFRPFPELITPLVPKIDQISGKPPPPFSTFQVTAPPFPIIG